MLKYRLLTLDDGSGQIEGDPEWCYDGIILPGGKIMIGLWRHFDYGAENLFSHGPFMFWNVPDLEGQLVED